MSDPISFSVIPDIPSRGADGKLIQPPPPQVVYSPSSPMPAATGAGPAKPFPWKWVAVGVLALGALVAFSRRGR